MDDRMNVYQNPNVNPNVNPNNSSNTGNAKSQLTGQDLDMELERLKEIIRINSKKQIFYTKILTVVLAAILAAFIVALCVILPPAVRMINHADEALEEATDTLNNANEAIEGVNSMTSVVTSFIETNSETVSDSMKKLQSVDFEGLNNAISDLEAVVEPMANLFGKR